MMGNTSNRYTVVGAIAGTWKPEDEQIQRFLASGAIPPTVYDRWMMLTKRRLGIYQPVPLGYWRWAP